MKRALAKGALVVLALVHAGCGYHLVHGAQDPLGPFDVVSGRLHAPDAAIAEAAEEGARAELARARQLGSHGAPGEIEIELLRVDEVSEGVALSTPNTPLARAVRVTAIGRGRLRRAGSASFERESGEVHASEVVARALDVGPAVVARDEAARAAARRLGERIVRRLLGEIEPGEP